MPSGDKQAFNSYADTKQRLLEDPSLQSSHPSSPPSRAAPPLPPRRTPHASNRAMEPPTAVEEMDMDHTPPPAYGDTFGVISTEKEGVETSARVTDDGRVDIRINESQRRLSGIFSPILRQKIQDAQQPIGPPPEAISHPPGLNVVIQVVGSRGDVQPFVALGKVLKDKYSHRVRLATHPDFKAFVEENGLEFFNIGGDPSRLMAFMVKNPRLMPAFRNMVNGDVGEQRKQVATYIEGCWRSCYESGDGMETGDTNDPDAEAPRHFVADCIIANPPSFAHIHCAEKLGIPLHIMFTMPYSPTQAYPHPLANIQSSDADPQVTNYLSYTLIEVLSWQGLGDVINRFRRKSLGLDPINLLCAPGMLHGLKIPHTYCWSPALIPKPKDWGSHISISGFYFLNLATSYTPNPDLQAFLDAGPVPVYIGFGSIVLDDPNALTRLIFEVAQKTGQRVLLSKGWGGLGADELSIPDTVFMIGNVPHDWLFRHVSCVVHHGGAGTTAAGITAGKPTMVVSFFGDQLFWGQMIARAGAGPDPIPYKQLTAGKLADGINFALTPQCMERAKTMASKIASERGSEMGAQSFHGNLDIDRLRCSLVPSRPAAWRVKNSKVGLSAFAACTLANAKLLKFSDLKPYRTREYNTDEGPWDPVTGSTMAVLGSFGGMMKGICEVPAGAWKSPSDPKALRQSSPGTRVASAKQEQPSLADNKSASLPLDAPSQTSEPLQPTRSRPRSLLDLDHLSLSDPSTGSSSASFQTQTEDQSDRRAADDGKSQRSSQTSIDGRAETGGRARQIGKYASKGVGRMAKTTAEAPMDFSVGLARGLHNLPKLWGDDTVRQHYPVRGIKSGAIAAGQGFGLGWYDGLTGVVTHPRDGFQKEGSMGLVKGIGKGIGGLITKPGAAIFGLPSHMMKGVQMEIRKAFGDGPQSYVLASRAAQGIDEWVQSSDQEKEDVIDQWKRSQQRTRAEDKGYKSN